jgi:5-methylthioribose kinase
MLLIDESNAESYLRDRGWLTPRERVSLRRLPGGVSNEVLYVTRLDRVGSDFVIKQVRPQLRTPEPWFASVERVWREIDVLRTCEKLLLVGPPPTRPRPIKPAANELLAATPRVLHEDRENYAFAMTAAPADHRVWKADLLGGRVEPIIAEACGRLLGKLHAGSWHDAEVAARLADRRVFDELRLDPYYRSLSRRFADFQPALDRLIESTMHERHSLVHADFSPKNLLVFHGGLLLVDFETGHYGDPAFDLGFFLSHLALKAAYHAPAHAAYLALATTFLASYQAEMAGVLDGEAAGDFERRAVLHFAACAWARLDGKSQVDYLHDSRLRQTVREQCQGLLRAGDPDGAGGADWTAAWAELRGRLDSL